MDGGACLVVRDPVCALQQFAAWHRSRLAIPVLGLTGSCGKTSSKELIAAVLSSRYRVVKTQGNFNNEIGCPLSLLRIAPDTEFAVIEMGANHAGEIARLCQIARPTEAAITLVAPSHLEGFGSIENIAKAKAEIVEALDDAGVFYVNVDNEWCRTISASFGGKKITFGDGGDVALESIEYTAPGEARLRVWPIGEITIPLACRAHASNVLLAIAVGLRHGISDFEHPLRAAAETAIRFKVLSVGPLTVIDDSYNANPASMAAAIDALAEWPAAGRRFAALGEMLELGDATADLHRALGQHAARAGINHVFVRGPNAALVVEGANGMSEARAEAVEEHEAIARAISGAARPGDVLLVKGSRGMRMERVIEELRKVYDTPEQTVRDDARERGIE
jgi:UDP-N-acetylmuramoyl-tripeptide--D-alanyl-D-alanine ligase